MLPGISMILVECFNDALPYRTDQSYGDRAASQIRVIYRIT